MARGGGGLAGASALIIARERALSMHGSVRPAARSRPAPARFRRLNRKT